VNTRVKILTGAEAAALLARWRDAGLDIQIAAGWFDPLLAASAEALAAWKRPGARLLVVLGDPPEAILAPRARAEMVAALRAVDAVVPESEARAAGLPASDHTFDGDHQALRGQFINHVLQRMS
jgi:hypothetical protein